MVDYHSDRDHVSRSDLALFDWSRSAYKRRQDNPDLNVDDDKTELKIGTGTHAVTLKVATELDKVKLIPAAALNSAGHKKGNNWTRFRLNSENRGKTLLLPKQWELCQQVGAALEAVELAQTAGGEPITIGKLVKDPRAERELEWRWTDVLPCRIKADLVIPLPNEIICIDLKTARSVDERQFRTEIKERKLWLQVAHYSAGLEDKYDRPVRFVFAAVEKKFPHKADVFELEPETVAIAKLGRLALLEQLKQCRESGRFIDPPRDTGIKRVRLTAADMGVAV